MEKWLSEGCAIVLCGSVYSSMLLLLSFVTGEFFVG